MLRWNPLFQSLTYTSYFDFFLWILNSLQPQRQLILIVSVSNTLKRVEQILNVIPSLL